MMFGCPKACGWCAAPTTAAPVALAGAAAGAGGHGSGGRKSYICVDFFENKCPIYKKEGRCTDPDEGAQMRHDCSFSCGTCTPPGGVKGFRNAEEAAAAAASANRAGAAVGEAAAAGKINPPEAGAGAGAGVVAAEAKPADPAIKADPNDANWLLTQMPLINHHQLQEDWADGRLPPEPVLDRSACSHISGTPGT